MSWMIKAAAYPAWAALIGVPRQAAPVPQNTAMRAVLTASELPRLRTPNPMTFMQQFIYAMGITA